MDKLKIEVGKYYKTRCGYKVIIYAIYPEKEWYKNIHGAFLNGDNYVSREWYQKGNFLINEEYDLDIVGEWVEPHPAESWEIDKKILVSVDDERWHKAYFSHFERGLFYTFAYGKTSWTQSAVVGYKYAKPAEEE